MIVTDIEWVDKGGIKRIGFYMDNYLVENLAPTPSFLAQDRDVVGIISGQGMTRNGKSTIANTIGYFLAWLIAGGRMDLRKDGDGNYLNPVVIKRPKKKVNFSFENLVYTPEDLKSTALKLRKKYGKEQLIIYDETKGLDSAGTMKKVNQDLAYFFQTCGADNNVILIVLPNFFKLNEDIATTRSMFLVDVYTDRDWRRGLYNFYGPKDKEWLYFNGKKRIGVGAKYASQHPTFYGSFRDWLPFDKEEYEAQKREKLKTRVFGSREQQTREIYWGVLAFLKTNSNLTTKEIAEGVSKLLYRDISPRILESALSNYYKYAENHEKRGDVS